MDNILKKYSLISHLNVSRETCLDFETFITMILERNKSINIISEENANIETIRERHVIDTAQIIDLIELNYKISHDLGAGGGFPGIVIAIMLKNMGIKIKMKLYEKSYHKSNFLKEVSKKLNLNTEIEQKNIFQDQKLESGTIMCRAFKPLPVVLELVSKNFSTYRNIILFMGKTGKNVLEETLEMWDFSYEKRESITNKDSFLLNIKNIKRKF
jgi:16S rRNA (guanine527-N7)-methyltransferase